MIFTIKDLMAKLTEVAAEHGDDCLVGIDDADTNWELPLEEFSFEPTTRRVLLKSDYYGEEWPTSRSGEAVK